jgi:hypothetical protein
LSAHNATKNLTDFDTLFGEILTRKTFFRNIFLPVSVKNEKMKLNSTEDILSK